LASAPGELLTRLSGGPLGGQIARS